MMKFSTENNIRNRILPVSRERSVRQKYFKIVAGKRVQTNNEFLIVWIRDRDEKLNNCLSQDLRETGQYAVSLVWLCSSRLIEKYGIERENIIVYFHNNLGTYKQIKNVVLYEEMSSCFSFKRSQQIIIQKGQALNKRDQVYVNGGNASYKTSP